MARNRAIVVGASIGGTLAAMAAGKYFDEVLLVERETLIENGEPRMAVPQGRQAHALLGVGRDLISELIPDFPDQLRHAGCSEVDQCLHLPNMTSSGWRARRSSPITSFGFRRPLLESIIRRNLPAHPNCRIVKGSVKGLMTDETGRTVIGVRLADGSVIDADLVIDASGRGSASPKWLEQLGYDAPDEQHVSCFMGYATQLIRVPDGVLAADTAGIVAMPYPGLHRGGLIIPVDNGLHMLTAAGMMRDYPPLEREALLEYLDGASTPLLARIARASEPVSTIAGYRMESSRLRRWHLLQRRPAGFLATGDAVASFNPFYGQGMTIAAKGAIVLRDCLHASADDGDLAERFQSEYARFVDQAFAVSGMSDTFYEGAELTNVTPPASEQFAYLVALSELAAQDADFSVALVAAHFQMEGAGLFTDAMRAKAVRWAAREDAPVPIDPLRIPEAV